MDINQFHEKSESEKSSSDGENKKLCQAIEDNDTELALDMLERENISCEYIDSTNNSSWTMLHWAAYHGNEKVVDALLGCNASSQYKTKRLLKNKNQVKPIQESNLVYFASTFPSSINDNTPLHRAAQKGHLSTCWLLLLMSYSTDDKDSTGNTPLHLSASNGHDRLVTCFINHGADVWIQNRFGMTALNVASETKCRNILRERMILEQNERNGMGDKTINKRNEEMRRKHIDHYLACESKILELMDDQRDSTTKSDEIDRLQRAIDDAFSLGVISSVISLGKRRKEWLELEESLLNQIKTITENTPIVSLSLYSLVQKLEELLELGAKMKIRAVNDDKAVIDLKPLFKTAHDLCKVSKQEMDLYNAIQKSDLQFRDTTQDESKISELQLAIQNATTIISKECICDKKLIENGEKLLRRLTSEVELSNNFDQLSKDIRLPIKNMTPKEAKEYWKDEDIGSIIPTKEYPKPPGETGKYVWKHSRVLKELQLSIEKAASSLVKAEEYGVNREFVQECRERLAQKQKECELLQKKDKNDYEVAISEACKLAKKKKKKKKH